MANLGSNPPARQPRRAAWFQSRIAWFGLLLVLAWLVAGFRTLGPEQFGVLESPLLGRRAWKLEGRWAFVPPGLFSLSRYPRVGVELELPSADELMLEGSDGSRFGLRGWVTLRTRPDAWATLHESAKGQGLEGLLIQALREAGAAMPPGTERGPVTPNVVRDLERGLSGALTERGLALRRLEVQAFDFLAALPAASAPQTGARLLVIGLDGADWEIMEPLLEQGRLPQSEAA